MSKENLKDDKSQLLAFGAPLIFLLSQVGLFVLKMFDIDEHFND